MAVQLANNLTTLLTAPVTAGAINIQVTLGTGADFPTLANADDYCYATLIDSALTKLEIVKITSIAGDVLTVLRGQDDTIGQPFSTGDTIQMRWNKAILSDLSGGAARTEMELMFKKTYNSDTYTEFTRVAGDITQIDIWETSAKTNKLFTKVITRTGSNITSVGITDDITGATLVTTITRTGSDITSLTKNYTA